MAAVPQSTNYDPKSCYNKSATIASSGTVSDEINLDGTTLCGVFIPSGFSGTVISFQAASSTGGAFVPIHDGAGVALSKTVGSEQYIPLDPTDFAGVRFVKIVSTTTQGTESILTLALRPV